MRSFLSPTALALAFTMALSPLAAAQHFAQPPPATQVASSELPSMPDDGGMVAPIIVSKATVRAALEQARAQSLSAFQVYMSNHIYPSNTQGAGKLNIWRDAEGHYCAAATIIRTSGRIALSEQVAATDNNLRLINVKDGALMDWILTSGLTQQEIDRIQEPFMFEGPDGKMITAGMSMGVKDPAKKAAEIVRLIKVYTATYAALEKNQKASLDIAVNRLMAHPDLARDFLDGSLAIRDLH